MAMPVRVRVTGEEYLASMTGENPSLEFVNGEVFQKPMPKPDHLLFAGEVLTRLREYRRMAGGRSGPEPTVDLSAGDDRRYRVPDAAYWAPGRPFGAGVLQQPPTLAIEVRSEGQAVEELRAKCREYRARGVQVCWLIGPSRRVAEVYEGARKAAELQRGAMLESAVLPGPTIPVNALWAALEG